MIQKAVGVTAALLMVVIGCSSKPPPPPKPATTTLIQFGDGPCMFWQMSGGMQTLSPCPTGSNQYVTQHYPAPTVAAP